MQYFLDTDICIYALKGTFPRIGERMRREAPSTIRISAIVKAELLLGALRSRTPSRVGEAVAAFLQPFEVVAFGPAAAGAYARIRHALEKKGRPFGPNDLILAATAMAEGACLVTHNVEEFLRVDGLQVEDWTE